MLASWRIAWVRVASIGKLRIIGPRNAMNRLKDKVAIVTGASRGIGKAVASEFARQEANLVVVGVTDAAAAQEVTNAIKAMGREAISVMADVSQRAEVDALLQAALDEFGRVDILVNNAGIISPSPCWRSRKASGTGPWKFT